jgi:hypothetical protein
VEYILSEADTKNLLTGSDGIQTYKGFEVVHRLVPHLERFTGYRSTKHSQRYDLSKEWTSFKGSDCAVSATFPEWHKNQEYFHKTLFICDVADSGLPG